jgi:hypothetical protein
MNESIGLNRVLWSLLALLATVALLVSSLGESSPARPLSCSASFYAKDEQPERRVQSAEWPMECWSMDDESY